MEETWVIYDIYNEQFFLGSNPNPFFGGVDDNPRHFISEAEAKNRIAKEFKLFPQIMGGRTFEIKRVLTCAI